jgi:hypothetical protein
MASVAELEAGLMSERTKKALAAAKAADDTARARKARSAKAVGHAASLAPIIARLDPDGSLSLRPRPQRRGGRRRATGPHRQQPNAGQSRS